MGRSVVIVANMGRLMVRNSNINWEGEQTAVDLANMGRSMVIVHFVAKMDRSMVIVANMSRSVVIVDNMGRSVVIVANMGR